MEFKKILVSFVLIVSVYESKSASTKRQDFHFPIPSSRGNVTFSQPQRISGVFDGQMKTYGRGVRCTGQEEGGTQDTVFVLQNGATLKNAIIGPDQIEGIHCEGSCTVENVWWSDVCEDALTLKDGHGVYNIIGGGAYGADDKVIQHNTGGQVNIIGFTVHKFGKLYRSCGNCPEQFQRKITIRDVVAVEGKTLVGINTNYGDTAEISDSTCATGVRKICVEYQGNDSGEEPIEIGNGPSQYCKYRDPLGDC